MARAGLKRMFQPGEQLFCDRLRDDATSGLQAVGVSRRYTAMVMIGLAAQDRLGRPIDLQLDGVWDRLVAWGLGHATLGEAGLVLWALALRRDGRTEEFAKAIMDRCREAQLGRASTATMPLGWLLAGLSEAMMLGLRFPSELAEICCLRLLANCCPQTGLFALGGSRSLRHPLAWRANIHLGSFASQVYPIVGLARYAQAAGDRQALEAARACARQICRHQGPQGQWWWIYHVLTGEPAIRYPVYSVHQDAMGPMALLAAGQAGGDLETYAGAIRKSLGWLVERPELPDVEMIRADLGVIWRAVQRDDPSRVGRFGLGFRERVRMNLAALVGKGDEREFRSGRLCGECRSYHLGWILLADAVAESTRIGG